MRLREHLVVLPLKLLPLRVAKFDVRLKEMPLQAVRAVQAMLTRMVLFSCNTCRERFPAFHPAYEPPGHVGLELLKHGAGGVARCNVDVVRLDEVPSAPDAGSGLCRRCDVQLAQEFVRQEGGARGAVLAKFGARNHMDPVWKFPHEELASLFQAASLTESMFVALEHMQVSFVTAQKTRLTKFRKNVISFAQDTPSFVHRVGPPVPVRAGRSGELAPWPRHGAGQRREARYQRDGRGEALAGCGRAGLLRVPGDGGSRRPGWQAALEV